jgi:hypothetical protein
VDWACDPTAGGQQRTYRGDELKIHGVMLWSCNGGQNEIWVHRSDREYALMVGGYRQCLTDPGYSTTNGTQLRVAACTGASDQQWSPP